jgi:integrase
MPKLDVTAAIRAGGNKRYAVGNGLSLYVRGGSAGWYYQWRDKATKKTRAHSLGSARAMNLSAAREARVHFQASLLNGTVPPRKAASGRTFGEALLAYVSTRAGAWTGGIDGAEADAHRRLLDLEFAKLPLSRIDTDAVRAALRPYDGTGTSTKIRTKIASVIDYAKASGWYFGDNPAARATMGKLLPAVRKGKPHEAMPWGELPAFMRELAAFDTLAAKALQWTILAAARASETRGATWAEIGDNTWSIGADRMKEKTAHTVPLTAAMTALLGTRGRPDELIFKSPTGKALNHSRDMLDYVRDRGYTVHGFRSTFVDWAAEHGFPSELRELALAHAVGDQVERSYRRTTLLNDRRAMMQAYSAFAASA